MKISSSKWFLIFAYLVIILPVGIFIAATSTQIVMKSFYFLFYGLPIDFSSIDYVRIFKGSIVGGIIGAIGCWWIYYRHYRKNR